MEIITGVERRRRWRLEEKLRIVAEIEEPGASFAAVARRNEVSRALLWNWRRQVRRGDLAHETIPVFVPVRVTPDPPLALPSPSADASEQWGDASIKKTVVFGAVQHDGWRLMNGSEWGSGGGDGSHTISA